MVSLFSKKLSACLHFSSSHSPHRLALLSLTPLLRLSTGTGTNQSKNPPLLAQYLISSFGFSPDRALRLATSKPLSQVKTLDRPTAVVNFLKDIGLPGSHVKLLISWDPQILSRNVTMTLQPRVDKLMAEGLSRELVIELVRLDPSILSFDLPILRIRFWRNFVGYQDDVFLKIIRMNFRLLHADIDNHVKPRIKFLKEHGFSDTLVLKVIKSVRQFILKKPESMKKLIDETEALGFSQGSNMFIQGLAVLATVKSETIIEKLEFLRKNYGLSEKEAHDAFKKFPKFVTLTEQKLKSQLDFLLGKAGLMKQDVFSKPNLLAYSLEKRIIPRHHVLTVLKCKGLSNAALYSAMTLSERDFLGKFVLPYKKEIPELEEAYTAACQGNLPV